MEMKFDEMKLLNEMKLLKEFHFEIIEVCFGLTEPVDFGQKTV